MADSVDSLATAVSYIVSGNASGIVGVFFSHPFGEALVSPHCIWIVGLTHAIAHADTVRIRMQVDGSMYKVCFAMVVFVF